MHAWASAHYSVHIGDTEAIAPVLSARLCRAYIAHAHCSSIAASIVLHSLASHTLQFDLADCGTFVVPTKVQAGFGTEAFKSVLSRQYRDGWTVCIGHLIFCPLFGGRPLVGGSIHFVIHSHIKH